MRCARCPELRAYAAQIARERKRAHRDCEYWGKPVPAFGDPRARVMIVGLAPGAHGSNRTGRPFTGDASGAFLYPALYRAGFASQPDATDRNDGLELRDCLITAAARCAPPQNKPTPEELRNCFPYLLEEFDALPRLRVLVALGAIAFGAILKLLRERGFALRAESVSPRRRSSAQRKETAQSPSSLRITRAVKTRTPASSPCRCSTQSSAGRTEFWSEAQVKVAHELLRARGLGASIITSRATEFFGNAVTLAKILFAAGDHHDAVDAQRHAAVRRRAVLERAHEEAETLLDFFAPSSRASRRSCAARPPCDCGSSRIRARSR